MFKQGHANGRSQKNDQDPYPPLGLSPLGLRALVVHKARPLTLVTKTLVAVDSVKLTYQPINEAAMDLFKRTSTNWAQMIRPQAFESPFLRRTTPYKKPLNASQSIFCTELSKITHTNLLQ